MSDYKCKMCGGRVAPADNEYGVCEFCGTRQLLSDYSETSNDVGYGRFLMADSGIIGSEAHEKNATLIIKRAFIFAEDGNWVSADEYCEKALDINPEYAPAYLCKLMVECRVTKPGYLANSFSNIEKSGNYQKAIRFGDDFMKKELSGYAAQAKINSENNSLQRDFSEAVTKMNYASERGELLAAAEAFRNLNDYKNSSELAEECVRRAEETRCGEIFAKANAAEAEDTPESLSEAVRLYRLIPDYSNSSVRIKECERKLSGIKSKNTVKNVFKYFFLAAFIAAKFVCSAKWASYLTLPAVRNCGGFKGFMELIFHIIGLMGAELVLTSVVSLLAIHCKRKNFSFGLIIITVLTVLESFMMSTIKTPDVYEEKFFYTFIFYLIFSVVCNFAVYFLMLLFTKLKKSASK